MAESGDNYVFLAFFLEPVGVGVRSGDFTHTGCGTSGRRIIVGFGHIRVEFAFFVANRTFYFCFSGKIILSPFKALVFPGMLECGINEISVFFVSVIFRIISFKSVFGASSGRQYFRTGDLKALNFQITCAGVRISFVAVTRALIECHRRSCLFIPVNTLEYPVVSESGNGVIVPVFFGIFNAFEYDCCGIFLFACNRTSRRDFFDQSHRRV